MKSYVCVLSTDNYLDGVLVLNENLKKLNSKYPLLCLVNDAISDDTLYILKSFDIKYKVMNGIDYINISDDERYGEYEYNKSYLKYTFDKLNIFSLIEYEKIVYLDVDLLILKNLDSLFDLPHISCSIDAPFHKDRINSGVLVLSPNLDDYNALITMCYESKKQNRQISDQDLINEYFQSFNILEFGYNMVREISNVDVASFNYIADELERCKYVQLFLNDSEDSKIIHYIGKNKPFMFYEKFDDRYYYLYMYYLNNILEKKKHILINKQNDLISVIVTACDINDNFNSCLQSILSQTYHNLEIIIIGYYLEEMIQDNLFKDKRIKFYNTSALNISCARNYGIKYSKGEYIIFVDSNDCLDMNMVYDMYSLIKQKNLEFVQCGVKYNDENRYCDLDYSWSLGNEVIVQDYLSNFYSYYVCDKIYRRDLFDYLKFSENCEDVNDMLFIYNLFDVVNKCGSLGKPLCHINCLKNNKKNYDVVEDNIILYLNLINYNLRKKYSYLSINIDEYLENFINQILKDNRYIEEILEFKLNFKEIKEG